MTSETTQSKPNYVLHIIYAAAFVLAVQIVVFYLIWNKMLINDELKVTKENIKHQQEAQALKEKEQKLIVSTCHKLVSILHKQSLADACMTRNNTSLKRYQNCLNEAKAWADYDAYYPQQKNEIYTYEVNECKRRYNMSSKPNQNCVLPSSIANKINADFHRMEKDCANFT